jgi:hypothetical protein
MVTRIGGAPTTARNASPLNRSAQVTPSLRAKKRNSRPGVHVPGLVPADESLLVMENLTE